MVRLLMPNRRMLPWVFRTLFVTMLPVNGAITTTTTNGNALIVGKAGDSKWFETDEAIDADYGFVYVRFIQSILDGHAS